MYAMVCIVVFKPFKTILIHLSKPFFNAKTFTLAAFVLYRLPLYVSSVEKYIQAACLMSIVSVCRSDFFVWFRYIKEIVNINGLGKVWMNLSCVSKSHTVFFLPMTWHNKEPFFVFTQFAVYFITTVMFSAKLGLCHESVHNIRVF